MKDQWKFGIFLVVVIFGLLWMTGVFERVEAPIAPEVCTIERAELTFYAQDKYTPATSVNANVAVREVGRTSWQYVDTGDEIEFAPGTKIEYLVDHDFTAGYGVKGTYEVPCKAINSIEVSIAEPIGANILGTYWNDLEQANTPVEIDAGYSVNVFFRFTGSFRRDLGNANVGYNILNCKYAEDEISSFEIAGLQKETTPDMIPTVAGMKDATYRFPVFESNTATDRYVISIVADELVNPVSNIVCTIYDSNYAIDGRTNEIIGGVEDNDGNNLGLDEGVIAASVTIEVI